MQNSISIGINSIKSRQNRPLPIKSDRNILTVRNKATGDNLDFIYVDVWGNQTATRTEDSWETRHLSDEITENGWRMTTEWGFSNEYDSTFQHWAADLTYGGYSAKGENSEVMRFLRNHQKDSWIGDYPSYGGAANAPLLGGYSMMDFEGWQGRNDYDEYIVNLYTHDLVTKFLQHYEIMKWVDGEPVQMKDNGETYSWTPEKEITLKDDAGNTVTAVRESTDPSSDAYRSRTITLNGKVISQGAVSRGDTGEGGTESYLLPWYWDSQTGDKVSAEEQKLYHWNTLGGTTTWELQDDWKSLASVKVYKLTDQGRTEEKTVDVVNGEITLEAEPQTPYVVCRGESSGIEVVWSEGMHLTDTGFNAGEEGLNTYWTKSGEGTATVEKSECGNPMLKLEGEAAVTQEITDLEPGAHYALYVGVDNRSDSQAKIEVKADGEVLDSNYTLRSIAKNYISAYAHNTDSATTDGTSYFQNMYVFFTAPEDGSRTELTISKSAGEGSAYFDDIRIVESEMDVIRKDESGNVTGLYQDFENSVQGIYPFVIGPLEDVADSRTHLSERHDPYTQAGWDAKKVDDVLDGDWSLKSNGLTSYKVAHLFGTALIYQTIPQNFRFEPGKTYRVSFDYQSGGEGTYAVITGDGEFQKKTELDPLPKAMGRDQDGHYEMLITGAESGQTWFGIYSTGTAPDTEGTSSSEADFGGYKDFVMDNLKIELAEAPSTAVLEYALSLAETADTEGVAESVLNNFNDAKAAAEDILARVQAGDLSVTQEMTDEAWQNLIKAMQYLSFKQGDKTDLQKVIDMAKSLDLNEYLDEGQQAFTDALAAAEAVLADGDAMQEEVDQSWKDLLKAMSELRLKPDKDALKDLIDEANGMSTEGADEETIAVFQNALAAAVSVYDNGQATEEEVVTAEEGLQAALDQLRAAVGDTEDPGNSGDDGNTGNGGSGQDQNGQIVGSAEGNNGDASGEDDASARADAAKNSSAQKSVKTGDTAAVPIAGTAVVMMLTAAAGVVAYRRRREMR